MQLSGNSVTKSLVLCTSVFAANAYAVELGTFGGTEVSIKGYLKMDAIVSNYDDGTLAPTNLGRDFYVPSLTPVGGETESSKIDMHSRQTRFGIGTKSNIDGNTLSTFIEMDFMTTSNGNERVTNSYSPRLRQAYLQYNNWLFGQTWSTFMDVGALPETLDFIGSTDATVFIRQSQIRYTRGSFQFALENPESTFIPMGGGGSTPSVTDDNSTPDIVVRYNAKMGDLSLVAAGLIRQLQYEDDITNIDDTESAYGVSLSAVYKLGQDDIKVLINSGTGMGRYVGLNISSGAVLDANSELEAIGTTAFYISGRHFWNDKWRSTLTYSTISIDNDTDLTGFAASKSSSSARLNLIYSPVANLSLGGELTWAERKLESDTKGSMSRFQFSAKLAF